MWLRTSDRGFRRQAEEEEEEAEAEAEEEAEASVVTLLMNCGNRGLGSGVLHLRFRQVVWAYVVTLAINSLD
jgi:hypothetical protein